MSETDTRRVLIGFIVWFAAGFAAADQIFETGDAGDALATAQLAPDEFVLNAISGSLADRDDADLYAIWIGDPAAFSATTEGAGETYDTQLFLFDAAGMGVLANDDILNSGAGYNPRSALPLGALSGPSGPGLYYLGVSGWDRDPHSAGGAMFTDDVNYQGVVGPGGPGGGGTLSGWDGQGDMNGALGGYTISLTGARSVEVIPEPHTMALLVGGAIGLAALRRRVAA